MHEHSLIKDLIKKIESVAGKHSAEKVTLIRIKLGALSHTTPEHFREHFNPLAAGTIAEEAALDFIVSTDLNDPHAEEIILDSIEVEEK